ncbi:uncharacterized protein K444DRAFT_263309 [Hyaloscypha bicolor E]|uniref:Uncharacterized protein n=1 Tax=Hyaloscypha bicolor E TaxID=1095630 RepID=A0A2J6SHK5_9HELO|nr:uncharacterized protein K444DRAFT_263309 [Hyaloscypha bicolor E]PMD50255.1 hypothetical protein K444DRAFT_263309 [Hyaloscypha bicolor E]
MKAVIGACSAATRRGLSSTSAADFREIEMTRALSPARPQRSRPRYSSTRAPEHQEHQEHQGIRASGHQGIRASGHQGIRASGHQGIRASGHQGIRASGHQGIRASGHQGIRASGHQGIRAPEHQSIRSTAPRHTCRLMNRHQLLRAALEIARSEQSFKRSKRSKRLPEGSSTSRMLATATARPRGCRISCTSIRNGTVDHAPPERQSTTASCGLGCEIAASRGGLKHCRRVSVAMWFKP